MTHYVGNGWVFYISKAVHYSWVWGYLGGISEK